MLKKSKKAKEIYLQQVSNDEKFEYLPEIVVF
jgi:hypothetical protein